MGENTKIQWAHHTFNPWRGCAKVSAGCANCYAETMSKRNPSTLGVWGVDGTRVVASEAMWRQPLKWNEDAHRARERRRVFCASMADVFEDRADLIEPRRRLFGLIEETPGLDWLLLTKRPKNARRYTGTIAALPNAWFGVSVENQATADERLPRLAKMKAAVRFVSYEPALEPVDFTPWSSSIDWIIVGGESGPRARPFDETIVRRVIDFGDEHAISVFVKQYGAKPYRYVDLGPNPWDGAEPRPINITDPKGGDPSEWPEWARVREVPA